MEKIGEMVTAVAKKVRSLSWMDRWLLKHPRIHGGLKKRLSTDDFTGLALTLLVFVFFCIVVILLFVIREYLEGDPLLLITIDAGLAHALYAFRTEGLLHFFYFLTLFAESSVIVILSILLSIFFWIKRHRIYIFTLWFALLLGEGLALFGKDLFHRERPDILLRAITESSFSFPSGHATSAILFYGFLAYLVIRHNVSWKIQLFAFSVLAFFISLIDLSRLYLGVHYASDVIAGSLIGFSSLIISVVVTEWLLCRKRSLTPERISSSSVAFVFLFAFILVFLLYFFKPL